MRDRALSIAGFQKPSCPNWRQATSAVDKSFPIVHTEEPLSPQYSPLSLGTPMDSKDDQAPSSPVAAALLLFRALRLRRSSWWQ